ncbi:MAG: hypothetical protein Q9159_005173 [Coniocarpon cinnabarinum]
MVKITLSKSLLIPERLARFSSNAPEDLLRKHLARFHLFPKVIEIQLDSSYLFETLSRVVSGRRQNTDGGPDGVCHPHIQKALERRTDRYIREAAKFAGYPDSRVQSLTLSVLEGVFVQSLEVHRRIRKACEKINRKALFETINKLSSQIQIAQWRCNVADDGIALKAAVRQGNEAYYQLQSVMGPPSQLELELAVAGCVVARLGLLVRRLRAQLKPTSCKCTLPRGPFIDADQTEPDVMRRGLEKKMKKTKRVNFEAKGVKVRKSSRCSSVSEYSLRRSVDQRQRTAFSRRSSMYQPGKWADTSGNGYVNTSGWRIDREKWEAQFDQPTKDQSSTNLKPSPHPHRASLNISNNISRSNGLDDENCTALPRWIDGPTLAKARDVQDLLTRENDGGSEKESKPIKRWKTIGRLQKVYRRMSDQRERARGIM